MNREEISKSRIVDMVFSKELKYSLSEIGVNSRQFSHWNKLGLFPFLPKNSENKKIKLSYSQCFIVIFVKTLMNYGLKTNIIEEFIKQLNNPEREESIMSELKHLIKEIKFGDEINEDYASGMLDGYLATIDMEYPQLKSLMLRMFSNRKEGGLRLIFGDGDFYVSEFIEGGIQQGRILRGHHIYLSLVSVFAILGVNDVGDTQNLMKMNERIKYDMINDTINNENVKKIEITKHQKVDKVKVFLPTPTNKKEEQEYLKKHGDNLEFTTKNYRGKATKSDFLYNLFLR